NATSATVKASIVSKRALVPQVHNPSEEWMWLLDSKYKETIPKGVWFCSTLFNGGLPTISPYGKQRVALPIGSVLDQLGGRVSLYRGKDSVVRSNRYVRLMLVKEEDRFECLEFMEKLNPLDNAWLKFISGSECLAAQRPNWVEIYCPYEIDIKDGEWDEVD
ncbi:uncharacterized protein, partial [Argopecten irradians]|uniref:uncharacterized protein n=1 Tax=Argopecten irradians TaxID=31199 RepID=UPI00371B570D